ncbi:hypothetical protein HDU76_006092, partial [Blyttiomyces sp. JEL0837]
MPNIVPSGANIRNSNISMVLNRATTKFNGTYVLSSLVDTTTATGASASVTLNAILPSEFGVDIKGPDGTVITSEQIPFTFKATQFLTFVAKSNVDYKLKDGRYNIPLTVTALGLTTPLSFQILARIQTPKPVAPGGAGSALYCKGRDHAYAKDFSFGQTYNAPSYTIEFWAYQFFILPAQYPTTVFSIGNWEVSFPDSWCWGIKSFGVPNSSFCRGRFELDLPDSGGYMTMYSGWNANNQDGMIGVDAKSRYGQWQHVAVTGDGKLLTLYINGEVAATGPDYGISPNIDGGYYHNYHGLLDEFRIWNISRSQSDIKSTMYTTVDASLHPELLTYYNFDEQAHLQDMNIMNEKLVIVKDYGSAKSDLILGGCVPNMPPYCKNENGTCVAENAPQVPCYTFTNETKPENAPTQFISWAPVSGYEHSYLIHVGNNASLKLKALEHGSDPFKSVTLFTITSVPSPENGRVYSSNGTTILTAGSKIKDRNIIFVPNPGRGGDPLDTVSFTVENDYTESNQTAKLYLRVLCPTNTYLNNGACTPCPYGTYSLTENFASSCKSFNNVVYSSPAGIILIIINTFTAIVTITTTIFMYWYRNRRVIIASSPLFCFLILSGCLLGHAIIYTIPILPTDRICQAQPIVEITAYSLVMCNIGIKTYRIHRIFNRPLAKKISGKDIWIKNPIMLSEVVVLFLINFAIFMAWYATDIPKAIEMVDSSGTLFWGCSSSSQSVQSKFNAILVVYQIIITLAALYFGMQVRYITVAEFNESKYIVMVAITIDPENDDKQLNMLIETVDAT